MPHSLNMHVLAYFFGDLLSSEVSTMCFTSTVNKILGLLPWINQT